MVIRFEQSDDTADGMANGLRTIAHDARQAYHHRPDWADNPYQPPFHLDKITQTAINTYLYSKQSDGTMGGLGWGWQSANGYTAMALHDIWSQSNGNAAVLSEALKTIERTHHIFVNEFNDDTLWWALCCVHVYNISNDSWFLEKAQDIYRYMNQKNVVCRRGQVYFRGRDMEGACYWTTRDGEEAINTITTGLYAELCVRLALIERKRSARSGLSWLQSQKTAGYDEYVEAARCSLGWILRCRYRDGIVLDGIMLRKDEEVDWTFTYVTGVALGVSALLYELLGQPEYIDLALDMANKAMRRDSWVQKDGVLVEWDAYGKGKHDPWQNSDGVGFKAVLMRQLGTLYDVLIRLKPESAQAKETAALIRTFFSINLQSQQENNTNGNGQYGPWWCGPFEGLSSKWISIVTDNSQLQQVIVRWQLLTLWQCRDCWLDDMPHLRNMP